MKVKIMKDKQIENLIKQENQRQLNHIELIASENFVSNDILEAVGSILTNKYAEGYPGKKYYGGCEIIDQIENLAIERAKKLFNAEHANVQPHSGSQANMGVYYACLEKGDTVLGMDLASGGHLTHGYSINFSGMGYKCYSYGVNKETEEIDYDEVERIALEVKPKMIIAGASAYSKVIDWKRFREICDKVGAYLMCDMAHYAGLVAANLYPSPVPYADFVTTTTHKTLRGPRGGLILCKEKYGPILDKRIFPGIQGGPLEHVIAGKAICFEQAMQKDFVEYQKQVLSNCQAFLKSLQDKGVRIVSGGSESHMFMIDLRSFTTLKGNEAEKILDSINITCNKNSIPYDPEKPTLTSGLRFGTPAMTTRGFKEEEFRKVGDIIYKALTNYQDQNILDSLKREVIEMVKDLPLNNN